MFDDNKNGHCALGPALLVAEKLLVRDELSLYTSTASFIEVVLRVEVPCS